MSNKTELQSNNLDLQAILDTVNNLPENEGGSATVTDDGQGNLVFSGVTVTVGV